MASGKSRLTSNIIYFIELLLILGVILASYKVADAPSNKPQGFKEPESLDDGDLVFRRGNDLISRLVLSQGVSSRFSHVGVIVIHQAHFFVVHSLPKGDTSADGVQIEPLSSFISSENASDVAFYRVKGIDKKSRVKIRRYILHQMGKPFDEKFQLSDDNRIYCSELAVKALDAAGLDILKELPTIEVMLINEPVLPPDYLRRSKQLSVLN
jgi:hypothetical protein